MKWRHSKKAQQRLKTKIVGENESGKFVTNYDC